MQPWWANFKSQALNPKQIQITKILNSKRYVISLGGSLINPGRINTTFLKKFRNVVLARVRKGDQFLITTGGGAVARHYQVAARKLGVKTSAELDWLGIKACDLNAELLKNIFKSHTKGLTVVSGGRRPPGSSDSTSMLYAQHMGAQTLINLTDVAGVYDKDPNRNKSARLIPRMTWAEFRKQFGTSRRPGQHVPFDPIAASIAEKCKIRVIIVNGRNLNNLQNILSGKKFRGTTIV